MRIGLTGGGATADRIVGQASRATAAIELGAAVLPSHAEATRDFPELTRHDPFDRLIVAQASRAALRLLTADHVLLDLRRNFIIDASR